MQLVKFVLIISLSLTIFNTSAQKNGYKKGYLILDGGKTQEGYIKYIKGSWTIWKSKPGKVKIKFNETSKPIKGKDDIKGFVIESDSFSIEKSITVNNMAPLFKSDFVRVLEVGKINLYEHQCTSKTNTGVGVGPIELS